MDGVKPMSTKEFRAALKRLGFAQSDAPNDLGLSAFARDTGYAPRSVRQWASEDGADVPPGVAYLLRLMLALHLSARRARKLLEE